MRPIALLLNIVVSSIATRKFQRAVYFRWRLFWPFAIVSIPMAFVGGDHAAGTDVQDPRGVGIAIMRPGSFG